MIRENTPMCDCQKSWRTCPETSGFGYSHTVSERLVSVSLPRYFGEMPAETKDDPLGRRDMDVPDMALDMRTQMSDNTSDEGQ